MTIKRTKLALLAILIIIVSSELSLSEAETLPQKIQPGKRLLQLQTQDASETRGRPDEITRVDPLNNFNKYRGSYNVTNMHYWSSTIFTGIYGIVIGLLWVIAGIVCAVYLLAVSCCRTKNQNLKKTPCHKPCYFFPLILTTVFTILAIVASGVALGGNIRFHSRAKTIMSVIINTADQATNTIYKATGPMRKIGANLQQQAANSVESVDGTDTAEVAGAANFLATTSDKLDYAATGIQRQAQKNRYLIEKGLTMLYILTVITICLNLAAAIALTVFGILRFQKAVHLFSSDTCTALHDFQQNPDNSSLSSILPCNEFLSARNVLSDVGIGIYEIVDQVNTNISFLKTSSLPSLEYVCNPFSGPPDFLYQPGNCAAGTIKIGDIPQVLKMFACSDTSGTSCQGGGGLISTSEYNVIEAYSNSIQNLLNAYPEMQNLVDCQLVKHASSKILNMHCKPLKQYAQTTWISMLVLSVVMVILVSVWASIGHHDQKHHSTDSSVQPNTTEANNLDPKAAKAAAEHHV
ncbi:Dystrophin [Bienertia sinuspersici]